MLLGTSHPELNGVLCDCDSASTTREHIQHFLQQFVDHEETSGNGGSNSSSSSSNTTPAFVAQKSSLVNHFKELLGNIHAQEHKHSSRKPFLKPLMTIFQ